MTVTITTYAKLNLSLRVYAPREDNYHPLQSIFQTISLHDTLTIETTSKKGIHITCNDPTIPIDAKNILYRTYTHLEDRLPIGLTISLIKRIPHGAGMGGGSTNAAGLLTYLNNTFLQLPLKDLIPIATSLGADVPFFLVGGTAYVEGIGEKITPIPPQLNSTHFLLVKPPIYCSTGTIFTHYDATFPQKAPSTPNQALLTDHLNKNDLKETVFNLDPRFKETETIITELTKKPVYMSGSGSTLFTPISNETYHEILPTLKAKLPDMFIDICTPIHGPAITIQTT